MSESSLNISKHLKASSFYCQELIVPHTELTSITAELGDLQRRFPQTFSNLNIVLNFSELDFGGEDIESFVLEAKICMQQLGHNIVGSIGIKSAIAQACGIKPVRHRIEEKSPTLISGKTDKATPPEESKPKNREDAPKGKIEANKLESLIIEESIRGGQSIYAEGKNLVIIGDVKRGAEVASDYSITVFGKLEGRAHAGVKGSTTSTIVCKSFDPELVSINGTYTANQDIKQEDLSKSVLVYLKEDLNKIIIRAS